MTWKHFLHYWPFVKGNQTREKWWGSGPGCWWVVDFDIKRFETSGWLTLRGRVTHICISKLTIIGSDNGLSPGRRQAIIWTNAGILLIGPVWTNFSEILIEIYTFSLKKMRLKISFAKWRPCSLGLNVLMLSSNAQDCLWGNAASQIFPCLSGLVTIAFCKTWPIFTVLRHGGLISSTWSILRRIDHIRNGKTLHQKLGNTLSVLRIHSTPIHSIVQYDHCWCNIEYIKQMFVKIATSVIYSTGAPFTNMD